MKILASADPSPVPGTDHSGECAKSSLMINNSGVYLYCTIVSKSTEKMEIMI